METEKDAIAPGTVAIAGVVAICHELAQAGVLGRAAVGRISEFMQTSVRASQASDTLQAHMHQALDHHFARLFASMPPDS